MSKNNSGGKRRFPSVSALVSQSLILPLFYRFAVFLYKSIRESAVGQFFLNYEKEEAAMKESFPGRLSARLNITDRVLRPLRFRIAAQFDHSMILNIIRRYLTRLASLSLATYGLVCLTFSFFSCMVIVAKFFLQASDAVSAALIGDIVVPAAALLIGICLVSSHHFLAEALCQSKIVHFFLFRCAGAKEEYFRSLGHIHGHAAAASVVGSVLGLFTAFLPAYLIPLGMAGLVVLLLIYKIPEAGVILALFALPFLPTKALIGLMMYLLLCFFLKYFRGKRTIHFGWLDLCVLLFMIVMLVAGVFSASPADSLFPVMVFLCFMCGYFLIVNLIRTSEWVERAAFAVVSSSTLVSLYGIYQNFFGGAATTWQDTDMFSEITGRVVSTFENPNVLAEYLIMCIPAAVAGFFCSKRASERLLYLFLCGISGACLIFTWSRGAWLGFMIAMLLFLLIYSKKTMVVMLFGMLAVPFAPFVLPASIMNRFLSIGNLADSSTSDRVHIWEGVAGLLKDHFLAGIGVGVGVFQKIYPRYTLAGIETAPHSHNLFLQILVETGIFGLILFFIFLVVYAKQFFTLSVRPLPEKRRILMAALFCGTLAVLAQGMTDYIWYDYRVLLVFWLMIGLTVAVGRTALEENRSPEASLRQN
ncbi:MAG: O-antigen ligase family protein [Clostridia bacterium]|nr:O-antigen ligase family protein [Clostridia bacterium]